MNIEDLSKTQLLLLTIMVNFVTSIATGVLTVSLLDQAPPTVIQTVNRIVDHTIETVTTEVPVIGNAPAAVPSSEELLTSAIATNAALTVRVYRSSNTELLGTGLYLPDNRSIFVASGSFPSRVSVTFSDGTTLDAEHVKSDAGLHRYGFAAEAVLPKGATTRLVPTAEMKQGQTAIAIGSDGNAVTGIISKIQAERVNADLPFVPVGAPAVNLSGDVIGMSLGEGIFIASDRINALAANQ